MCRQLLLLIIVCSLTCVKGAKEFVAFVTPRLPACYVALTQYENVNGAAKLCPHGIYSRSVCGKSGVSYYFYCSEDHDCCYNNGCPACCTSQTTLNRAEIAGVVIACSLSFAIILALAYVLAGKFCAKKSTS